MFSKKSNKYRLMFTINIDLVHVDGLKGLSTCENNRMVLILRFSFSQYDFSRQFDRIYFLQNKQNYNQAQSNGRQCAWFEKESFHVRWRVETLRTGTHKCQRRLTPFSAGIYLVLSTWICFNKLGVVLSKWFTINHLLCFMDVSYPQRIVPAKTSSGIKFLV